MLLFKTDYTDDLRKSENQTNQLGIIDDHLILWNINLTTRFTEKPV